MSLQFQFSASTLTCAILVLALGPPASAQPASSASTFDLILVGDSLAPSVHHVELRTNPADGGTWTPIEGARCPGTKRLMVLPNQPVQRLLGQDVRENYLALKIRSETSGGSLRAVYAVPSAGKVDAEDCGKIARLIRTQPRVVRRSSLANYERPRPTRLQAGTPFIDHAESPVRHRKPGVTEVEWLEILFR